MKEPTTKNNAESDQRVFNVNLGEDMYGSPSIIVLQSAMSGCSNLMIEGAPSSGVTNTTKVILDSILKNNDTRGLEFHILSHKSVLSDIGITKDKWTCYDEEKPEDRYREFLLSIKHEINDRIDLLLKLGYNSYAEYINDNPDKYEIPRIVVVMEDLEKLCPRAEPLLMKALRDVLRAANPVGIVVIANALDSSRSMIPEFIFNYFKQTLSMNTDDDSKPEPLGYYAHYYVGNRLTYENICIAGIE